VYRLPATVCFASSWYWPAPRVWPPSEAVDFSPAGLITPPMM
jgi:hypothetical protein